MPRVFFITGTSTGFGNHLVQEVIDHGDIAVATARKPESLSFKNTNEKVRPQCHILIRILIIEELPRSQARRYEERQYRCRIQNCPR
jgi:NAD(P)-dependent dehydrogenase (short-subunit alcohol dehydrogenase family)